MCFWSSRADFSARLLASEQSREYPAIEIIGQRLDAKVQRKTDGRSSSRVASQRHVAETAGIVVDQAACFEQ